MASFLIFGDFLAINPALFFQIGLISATVRHDDQKGQALKIVKKYAIRPF